MNPYYPYSIPVAMSDNSIPLILKTHWVPNTWFRPLHPSWFLGLCFKSGWHSQVDNHFIDNSLMNWWRIGEDIRNELVKTWGNHAGFPEIVLCNSWKTSPDLTIALVGIQHAYVKGKPRPHEIAITITWLGNSIRISNWLPMQNVENMNTPNAPLLPPKQPHVMARNTIVISADVISQQVPCTSYKSLPVPHLWSVTPLVSA